MKNDASLKWDDDDEDSDDEQNNDDCPARNECVGYRNAKNSTDDFRCQCDMNSAFHCAAF